MVDNKNIDIIIKTFKKNNLKLTLQRMNIYSYLMSTCEHPTVDTIYTNIRKTIPTISLATVYKNLNTLVNSGLIKLINVCEENFRYDANLDLHAHFKCTSCNKVEDLYLDDNVLKSLLSRNNTINNLDVFLYGTCTCCSGYTKSNN